MLIRSYYKKRRVSTLKKIHTYIQQLREGNEREWMNFDKRFCLIDGKGGERF